MFTMARLDELKERLCQREHLTPEECDRTLLPTLEHASLVHSGVHEAPFHSPGHLPEVISSPHHEVKVRSEVIRPGAVYGVEDGAEAAEEQRSAMIYISLVVLAYVVVVAWLVSSNFRSAAAAAAASGGKGLARYLGGVVEGVTGAHRRRRKNRSSQRTRSRDVCSRMQRCCEGSNVKSAAQQRQTASGLYRFGDQYFEVEEEEDGGGVDGVYLFEEDDNSCCFHDDDEVELLTDCHHGRANLGLDVDDDEDDDTEEALLVLQDEKGRRKPKCTTKFDEEEYVGDPV